MGRNNRNCNTLTTVSQTDHHRGCRPTTTVSYNERAVVENLVQLSHTRDSIVHEIEEGLPQGEAREVVIEMYQDMYASLVSDARVRAERFEALKREVEPVLAEGKSLDEDQQRASDEYRQEFLHLEETAMLTGGQVIDVGLIRIRLGDISAWALGRTGNGQ